MKKLLCFLFEHKVTQFDNDFAVCGRCTKHEYMDGDTWRNTLPDKWFDFKRQLITRPKSFLFTRCDECGKLNGILGRYTGDHSDCLPF